MEVFQIQSPDDSDTMATNANKTSMGREKNSVQSKSKKGNNNGVDQVIGEEIPPLSTGGYHDSSRIKVSMFDHSVENHFTAIDMISKLCGLDNSGFDGDEIARLASSITFLREWRYFNYEPRAIKFLSKAGHSSGAEAHHDITLSQFSAAMVPKCTVEVEKVPHSLVSTDSRKDFILYAGGLVWALDWCPRLDQGADTDTKCEFIAVAAHPPDSSYHKLGAPLIGRGMIQVWCLLNYVTRESIQASAQSTKRRYKKSAVTKKGDNSCHRSRGRPRKNVMDTTLVTDLEGPFTRALVQVPEDISPFGVEEIQSITSSKEPEKKAELKSKKPGGRASKVTIEETPVEVPENQFIPALDVQLPDSFVDEISLSNPVSSKEKKIKRKPVNNKTNTVSKTADVSYSEGLSIQALAVEFPESMVTNYSTGDSMLNASVSVVGKRRRIPSRKVLDNDLDFTIAALKRQSKKRRKLSQGSCHKNRRLSTSDKDENPSLPNNENCLVDDNMIPIGGDFSDFGSGSCHDLNDIFVPRVVLCVGHDGKVAWDVKWRPNDGDTNKLRMGYLAVALGNGSIEVWEVPSPQVINCVYSSHLEKDTDPRFVKLKPVFRCSKLNYGNRQSLPLTLEWSASPPHDLLLAGCHDGVVALWKFSTDVPSEDARPLLCFSADTDPIRALSWAPFEGDLESSNVIVTAGEKGLKFWDLRDPFRPLWDAIPSQRFIYGLDWLPDPRCLIVSYDDGTLRIVSLLKAVNDVPVTGQPFSGTHLQGLHSFLCSSSAIWSIHVSRHTGVVAYCCADGAVLYFQLTHKAVEKDPCRHRAPHFLCGSLTCEDSGVAINTDLPSSPQPMKKSATEWAATPRSARAVVSNTNLEKKLKKCSDKSSNPDEQVLALCYGDETQRGTTGSDRGPNNGSGKAGVSGEAGGHADGPPPKIVSMYRVRWNLNKGSERWLCYGGAAGIVRCQEIVMPVIDKKLLRL